MRGQASWGCGSNPARGDVLLHCREGTGPSTPCLPQWGFGLKLGCSQGMQTAQGYCSCQGPYAMLGPGAATELPWEQPVQHPGARPPRVPAGPGWLSPTQQGGIAPGCSLSPSPLRTSAWGASPKKPVPEGNGSRRLGSPPAPPSLPPLGTHPAAPCSLHSPIPFRLSCLGEEEAEEPGRREKELEEASRGERSKKGQGGRAGYQTSYEKPCGSKTAAFHTRLALERYRTGFGSDVQGGSGGSS